MINASVDLQDLRRRIYTKAKADKSHKFWGLYAHVCKKQVLLEAYRMAKANGGAPGIDGVSFKDIAKDGANKLIVEIRDELRNQTYRPSKLRRKDIPKEGGRFRTLGIPTIKDRIVQGALKLILEPIFEADFKEGSYGYRPKKNPHQAIAKVAGEIVRGKTKVIDVDIEKYFDTIRHDTLLAKIAQRVSDPQIMRLIKLIVKAGGKRGVGQGTVISPLFANIYLNEVDRMLEKAKQTTRKENGYTRVEYARFADDLVILVDGYDQVCGWLIKSIQKRLLEELEKLDLKVNLDKTKLVDLAKDESFSFLGFDLRRVKARSSGWSVLKTPRMKARVNLTGKLKDIFKRFRSKPVNELIAVINPILRGWVNYYRGGNSWRQFHYVRRWVELKLRRHLRRARGRPGFGWNRWSTIWLYDKLGLYNDYQLKYFQDWKALPV